MKKQSLFYNIICVLALTACSSSTRYVISGTVPAGVESNSQSKQQRTGKDKT